MNTTQIKLDIGCGMKIEEGFIGVDSRPFKDVKHVLNIGKEALPYPNNSVDEIRAIHVYEHLYPEELFFSINECWRVLKPDGFLHIEVPKAGTRAYYIHPDHKLQFTEDTFGFFQVPADGIDPHGYLTDFWHVSVLKNDNPEAIHVDLYPNKPDGRYEYKEIKRYYE